MNEMILLQTRWLISRLNIGVNQNDFNNMNFPHLMRRSQRTVFYSIAAQPDNLGDIEIRKVVLDWIEGVGLPIYLYVGSMPQDYIDAYCLPPTVEISTSLVKFQLKLMMESMRFRSHIVFAPGPQPIMSLRAWGRAPSLRHASIILRPLINLADTVVVKITGGKVLTIGRSLVGTSGIGQVAEYIRSVICDLYTVRDEKSSRKLSRNARVTPDVAFFNVSETIKPISRVRVGTVVFSLRADRDVDEVQVLAAVNTVRHLGGTPIFLTQVLSDNERNRRLAEITSADFLGWESTPHREQIGRVKRVYKDADIVVSDRLHALIFGAQQGAIPLAVIHAGESKLEAALNHVMPFHRIDSTGTAWSDKLHEVVHVERSNVEFVTAARDALDQVNLISLEVQSLLGGRVHD